MQEEMKSATARTCSEAKGKEPEIAVVSLLRSEVSEGEQTSIPQNPALGDLWTQIQQALTEFKPAYEKVLKMQASFADKCKEIQATSPPEEAEAPAADEDMKHKAEEAPKAEPLKDEEVKTLTAAQREKEAKEKLAATKKTLTEKVLEGFEEKYAKPAESGVEVENHGAAAGNTQLG